jgi:hypothetical protein
VNHSPLPHEADLLDNSTFHQAIYLQTIYASDTFCDCHVEERCSIADMNEAWAERPAEESDARDRRGGAGREEDGQVPAHDSTAALQIDASERKIPSMLPC